MSGLTSFESALTRGTRRGQSMKKGESNSLERWLLPLDGKSGKVAGRQPSGYCSSLERGSETEIALPLR